MVFASSELFPGINLLFVHDLTYNLRKCYNVLLNYFKVWLIWTETVYLIDFGTFHLLRKSKAELTFLRYVGLHYRPSISTTKICISLQFFKSNKSISMFLSIDALE